MRDTMALCVSCKGCRRECPTGVDMAKMKIEFRHHYNKRHGLSWRDRLVAYLPRYAPYAARVAGLLNLRNRVAILATLTEKLFGFSAQRPLPVWSSKPYRGANPHPNHPPLAGDGATSATDSANSLPRKRGRVGVGAEGAPEVLLLVDTFNRYFEPENAAAAERVLSRAGYRVTTPEPQGRPLCCGRSFLAAGLVDEAKAEARRMLAALAPAIAAGTPIVGLEPSCLLTLRDEFPAMLPGAETTALSDRAQLFEEFVETERAAGRFNLPVAAMPGRKALLHGHCHQKAFATAGAAAKALQLIPELEVETFDSTCCGMAGSFGYEAEHYEMSLRMGELGVLPRMRSAASDTLLAACGTSCRHQI